MVYEVRSWIIFPHIGLGVSSFSHSSGSSVGISPGSVVTTWASVGCLRGKDPLLPLHCTSIVLRCTLKLSLMPTDTCNSIMHQSLSLQQTQTSTEKHSWSQCRAQPRGIQHSQYNKHLLYLKLFYLLKFCCIFRGLTIILIKTLLSKRQHQTSSILGSD